MMDLGVRNNDKALIDRAIEIYFVLLNQAGTKKMVESFISRYKRPSDSAIGMGSELWWVHLETLISMAKGYRLTGNEKCKKLVQNPSRIHLEALQRSGISEWFGYLNREGNPLLELKGGKWKGCFHVPRGLYEIWKILE